VTGVQTCALPISRPLPASEQASAANFSALSKPQQYAQQIEALIGCYDVMKHNMKRALAQYSHVKYNHLPSAS